jgi:hypothetical protein
MIVAFWRGAAAGAGFAVAFWTTLIVYSNDIERAVARQRRVKT